MDKYIQTRDRRKIYYKLIGKGFPLIFLHGNNLNLNYFVKQEVLAENHQLILIDSRNHGDSENQVTPLTFEQMADDVEGVLREERVNQCIIIGHSDGANLGLMYAKQYPNRVRGMVLNGGNYRFSGLLWPVQIGIYFEIAALGLLGKFSKKFANRYLVSRLMLDDVNITESDMKNITVPSIVIVGAWDMIKRSHSKEFAEHLGNGKLMIVPRTGHDVALHKTKEFNELINHFTEVVNKGESIENISF